MLTTNAGFVIPVRLVDRAQQSGTTGRRLVADAPGSQRGVSVRAKIWLCLVAAMVWLAAPARARAGMLPNRAVMQTDASRSLSLGAYGLQTDGRALAPTATTGDESNTTSSTDKDVARDDTKPTLIRKRSIPPLWIDREFDTHRTRAIAFPPIFVHRAPKSGQDDNLLHVDLSLTFGWYSKRLERRRWFNPAGLFFGGFSKRKTTWGAVPLLMGYRRVGEQFNFGQFPLVWWWGTKFVKNFLVVPFHYQKRTPESFSAISAVLFWYGNKDLQDADLSNDRRYFVAAPLFWRFQRGLKRFDFAFLYIGGYNKLKGLKYTGLAPFFIRRSSEFGNRKELWTLAWIRRRDKARQRSSWAVPIALTFGSDNPDRKLTSSLLLYWRTRNKLKASTFTYAGLYGRYDDPAQRNSFFAPLWYRFEDKQAQSATSILVPLAFARRTPQRRAVWTLLGGGRRTSKGWAFGATPILTYAARKDDGTTHQTVAALFWHRRNPNAFGGKGFDRWVLPPLFYGVRNGSRRGLGLLPLLTFAGWGETKSYQVITPLIWHVRDKDPNIQRRTVVTGPFYHHRTKAGFDGGLVPLAFYGRNDRYRYGIVPGVLVADVTDVAAKHRLTLSPVFIRSKAPDHRSIGVLGFIWDVTRPGNERDTAVVPVFYRRRRGDRALTITPIGGGYRKGSERTAVFGPFYRRKTAQRDGWGILPVLFHDSHPTEGGRSTHTVLAPLFLRRRTPQDDLDMWTPLIWRSNIRGARPRRGLSIIPVYFRQRQPRGVDVDAGIGFFFSRNRVRRTHTLIVGPGFHRLSRTGLNAGIVPLYWWSDNAKKRRLLALPTIFHFADKGARSHTTIAIPFWFDRKRANGRRTWGAFPFVFGGKRLYNFTRFSLAPPGYFDIFRLKRNTRFTGYVPLLFRFQKCGFREEDEAGCQYTLWGSFPLFLAGKDGRGRRSHAALLLYYWDKSPDRWRLYTPLFGINNKPGKVLGWYAGPLGVKTTGTHRRTMFFPLYFRRTHRLKNRSLTLAVPPLFIARQRMDRSFFEAGLLVWQFRQQHKVSLAVVPPVFFHSHAYAQRRLTWLAPLFLRDNNMGKDQTWTAIPPGLYVQRRKGPNLDFVQFPLVWHIERAPNQGTVGGFVWWDIRVKSKMFQMVPVAFFRWKTPDGDTKIIGPGLGWWTNGDGVRKGDLHWRALFGLFGGGREGGRRYTSFFGARFDKGPVSAKASARIERRTQRRQRRLAARRTAKQRRKARRAARRAPRTKATARAG